MTPFSARSLRALCLVLPLLAAAPPSVIAQPATTAAARDYTIAPGSLAEVLGRFAAASDVALSFSSAALGGRQSPGLQGRHTVEDGFAQLLAGTGLLAERQADGSYLLRRQPEASTLLPAVKVQAQLAAETATGPVGGYVARRSATGTKTDSSLLETPQSISVVTREEFTARGATRTVLQALEYTPGVLNNTTVDTRYDYGKLRGFPANKNTYLDGLNLPYGLDRAAPQIEPYGLERVEVLKGPSSVLYGQNEPGGLINTVSKRPTAERRGELQLALGSYNRRELGADLSGPLSSDQQWQYRLVGFGRDSETQLDFVKDDRVYLAPSLRWQPGARTELTLLSYYQRDRGGEFNNYLPYEGTVVPGPLGYLPVSRTTGEPGDRYDRDQYGIGYAFEHRFDEAWSLAQNFRYQYLDVVYDNVLFPDLREDGRTVDRTLYQFDENLKAWTLDTRVQGALVTGALRHTLLAGVDYREQKGHSENGYHYHAGGTLDLYAPVYGQPIEDLGYNSIADTRLEQWGLYLQDQIRLDRWALLLGGRYDDASTHYDSQGLYPYSDRTQDSAFTGRAGLVYLADGGWAPYLSWSESFQPQSLAGVDYEGRAFDPVTGRQYEAGLKFQPPGQTAFVTLSAFDLAQQNMLTEDLDHKDEGFFQKQVGEVRVRGLELEGKAEFGRLSLVVAYALMKSEFTRSNDGNQGLEKENVPRHQASLWADYHFTGAAEGVDLGAGLRYTDRYFGDSFEQIRNESVTLIDLAAGFELGRLLRAADGLRLALNLRNASDEKYVSCSDYGYCSYGMLRTVQGTLSYRW